MPTIGDTVVEWSTAYLENEPNYYQIANELEEWIATRPDLQLFMFHYLKRTLMMEEKKLKVLRLYEKDHFKLFDINVIYNPYVLAGQETIIFNKYFHFLDYQQWFMKDEPCDDCKPKKVKKKKKKKPKMNVNEGFTAF